MSRIKTQNKTNIVLGRISDYYGLKYDIDIANYFGISESTVSSWRTRNSINEKLIRAKCGNDLANWFINGIEISANCKFQAFSTNIIKLIDDFEGGNKDIFASSIGVHYETVRRWCNGDTLPDGTNLLTIHNKYNVSIDWLLTGNVTEGKPIEDWSPKTKESCLALKRIIESGDTKTAGAMLSLLDAFSTSIDRFEQGKINEAKLHALIKSDELTKQELAKLQEAVRHVSENHKTSGHRSGIS